MCLMIAVRIFVHRGQRLLWKWAVSKGIWSGSREAGGHNVVRVSCLRKKERVGLRSVGVDQTVVVSVLIRS